MFGTSSVMVMQSLPKDYAVTPQERQIESPGMIPHTFHWPGDKCPTVDMSKAFRRICFFGGSVR